MKARPDTDTLEPAAAADPKPYTSSTLANHPSHIPDGRGHYVLDWKMDDKAKTSYNVISWCNDPVLYVRGRKWAVKHFLI